MHQAPRHRRAGLQQILGCVAVAAICAALIALIWINAERSIREQADDTRGRVEAAITAQATTLAAQAQHELLMIDQSLSVLQTAWNGNPDTFNLADWRKEMPALTAVADDLFIANDQHLIVQDINPAAVGQGIGSAYATFATGSLEPIRNGGPNGRDHTVLVGELGSGGITRQYLMYMVRPLDKPPGWVIGASYRSSALTAVFASAGLGEGGLAALVDTHRGNVQAVAGTAALRPRLNIGNTAMYAAMQERPDGGVWIGHSSIDGVERILAFRPIPGRDLIVLVGVVRAQAMAPAETWAIGIRALAVLASVLVLAVGATLLWELRHWRGTVRRRRALVQAEALLAGAQGDLAAMRARATLDAAQLQAVLGMVPDGVALFNRALQLVAWNPGFAALSNPSAQVLRSGLPLAEVLRQQVLAGRFGVAEDVAAEVARGMAALSPESGAGEGAAELTATGPDGTQLLVHALAMPDGAVALLVRPASLGPASSGPASLDRAASGQGVTEAPAAAASVAW